MGRSKRRTFGLSVGAVVLALVVLEALARLVGEPDHRHDPTFVEALEWSYPRQIAKDNLLFWTYRPNQVINGDFLFPGIYTINSLGFRGPEPKEPKPTDEKRVVCFGGSTTFGWGVSDAHAYPRQLELQLDSLDPEHRHWEVINAGITDYSTFQGVALARRWLPVWKPDIVLYNFSWADHQPAGIRGEDVELRMPPEWRLRLEDILRNSYALQWAERAWVSVFDADGESRPTGIRKWRVGLTDFIDNLERLTRAATDAGARPVFVTSPISWPPPGQSDTSGVFHYHQRYRRAVRYGAVLNGAEYVELANAFDNHREFFDDIRLDNEHFNAAGHAFAAEFLARYILSSESDTTDSDRDAASAPR